jgi:hypothetical protein
MENIARQRVTEAVGHENMSKIALTFIETDLDDLKMHVEGPDDLKAKIEEALRAGTH